MYIQQIEENSLEQYAEIPISLVVTSVLRVHLIDHGFGGMKLVEEECDPYVKDYDGFWEQNPRNWATQFNLKQWGLFVAVEDERWVGGAAVSLESAEAQDAATLWDLRVHPKFRGMGIGSKLLEAGVKWSKERRCSKIAVETQNVNVSACRFYSRNGFSLAAVDVYGYAHEPSLAHEVKLIWMMAT